MSTASLEPGLRAVQVPARAIVRRFVWKEFRMLRALWLAVLVMGVMIQWAISILSHKSAEQPSLVFAAGLAAAVLYAVGAAATTFSVEHEEETYDFLAALPATWRPVYVGKLSVVVTSAVALAISLSVVGWVLCGFELPRVRDGSISIRLFGTGILEAVAWGTLLSLLVKRPLVAAILTLIAEAAAVNLAVYVSCQYPGANLKSIAYVEAVPLRLAIVVVVFAASAIVARRWLAYRVVAIPRSGGRASLWWGLARRRAATRDTSTQNKPQRVEPRRMMARLIWQTWRDARKVILLPIVVAGALMLGVWAWTAIAEPRETLRNGGFFATSLFVPALYGAMAFSSDQRRRSYAFLAQHAARPGYVWLARQIVWLGALVVLTGLIWLVATMVAAHRFESHSDRFFEDFVRWGSIRGDFFGVLHGMKYTIEGAILGWFGILIAYAIGQFCSMLMRSEILAAFIALVLSVFLAAWVAVLFVWDLSGWLFLLPLAAALMLATWLRTPDWLIDRHSWRAWLKSTLPVVAVLVAIGFALPMMRIAQVDRQPIATRQPGGFEVTSIKAGSFTPAHLERDPLEARKTAAMYLRAVDALHAWEENDPLEPWHKPEYARTASTGSDIDESKIPPDQREEFTNAKQRREELIRESQAAAAKLAIEASARPTCFFDFDLSDAFILGGVLQWDPDTPRPYSRLNELLKTLWSASPDVPFDQLLAALRMSAHLRSGQLSIVLRDQLANEKEILHQVGQWAANESRTKEELKAAIDQLTAHFRMVPSLPGALTADHQLVAKVLRGEAPSMALERDSQSWPVHLAYLANELPWERERALLALNAITFQNVTDAGGLDSFINRAEPYDLGTLLRHWLMPRYVDDWKENWVKAQQAAATSYLAKLEYQTRAPVHDIYRAFCDNQMYRRAALLQVALIAYRRDHGVYPTWLAKLMPDYLLWVPIDPYSGQQFVYMPAGLDLPLQQSYLSDFDRIEANTPLFWSVGAGRAHLNRSTYSSTENNEDTPLTDGQIVSEIVYVLEGEEPFWRSDPSFAFPLPK